MRMAKVPRKRGRKVNAEFESAVLGNLVYSVLQKVNPCHSQNHTLPSKTTPSFACLCLCVCEL